VVGARDARPLAQAAELRRLFLTHEVELTLVSRGSLEFGREAGLRGRGFGDAALSLIEPGLELFTSGLELEPLVAGQVALEAPELVLRQAVFLVAAQLLLALLELTGDLLENVPQPGRFWAVRSRRRWASFLRKR
jgi:hypothetical protein